MAISVMVVYHAFLKDMDDFVQVNVSVLQNNAMQLQGAIWVSLSFDDRDGSVACQDKRNTN